MKWLMMWTTVTIDVTYIILFTTLTGSVFTLAWFIAGQFLDGKGYFMIRHQLLKVVLASYLLPVVYAVLKIYKRITWDISLLESTPVIFYISIVINAIWIVVSIVFFITSIHDYCVLHRSMKDFSSLNHEMDHIVKEVKQRLHIKHDKVKIVYSFNVSVPQITGIMHPKIILPVCDYSEKELEIILLHELTHYKQEDLKLKLFMILVKNLHFFNPLVWFLNERLNIYCEITCDNKVCSSVGMRTYFNTILNLAVESSKSSNMAACFGERKDELMERVEYAVKIKNAKKCSKITAGLLTAGMLLMSSTTVFGASVGLKEVYRVCYEKTDVCVEVPLNMAEMEEQVISAKEQDDFVEISGEISQGQRSTSNFSWTVYRNTRVLTSAIYLEKGQSVSIFIVIDPDDKNVGFGIKNPDGSRVTVTGNDVVCHTFDIETTGYYQIFVESANYDPVQVDGSYIIK